MLSLIAVGCKGNDLLLFDLGDASDPTFPTKHLKEENRGPALLALDEEGEFLSRVILGECVTVESEAESGDIPGDDCDDSGPSFERLGGRQFSVVIQRTDAPAEGNFWLNMVVDLNFNGEWDSDDEWLVRNCVVPENGEQRETLTCDIEPTETVSIAQSWMRIVVSDLQVPGSTWDGSAFFDPGEARGEVEDFLFDIIYDMGDAPDGPYPTSASSNGPQIPFHVPEIGLGDCTTWEYAPNFFGDACDDGDPGFDLAFGLFGVDVSADPDWVAMPMFINVVFDFNEDGWDPQKDWIVRNCPVPFNVQNPLRASVICSLTASMADFAAIPVDSRIWYRVLMSEAEFSGGWDGSVAPNLLRYGEVEDYAIGPEDFAPSIPLVTSTPVATPIPTATQTPLATSTLESTTTAPASTGKRKMFEDPLGDVKRCDSGAAADDSEVDIGIINVERLANGDLLVEVKLGAPLENDFSFAVLLIIKSGDKFRAFLWEIHDGVKRVGEMDLNTGQLIMSTLDDSIQYDKKTGIARFTLSKELVPDAVDQIVVRSFHTPTRETQPQPTHCDEAGPFDLPPEMKQAQ